MRNVLLVIDVQKGFVRPQTEYVVKNIRSLLSTNRFDEIIQTKYVNSKGSMLEQNLGYVDLRSKDSQELVINIRGSKTIERCAYSAVTNKLTSVLTKKDRIFICGLETDACVLATMFELFDLGYTVKCVEDAVGTNAKFSNEMLLELIERNFGRDSLVSIDEMLVMRN